MVMTFEENTKYSIHTYSISFYKKYMIIVDVLTCQQNEYKKYRTQNGGHKCVFCATQTCVLNCRFTYEHNFMILFTTFFNTMTYSNRLYVTWAYYLCFVNETVNGIENIGHFLTCLGRQTRKFLALHRIKTRISRGTIGPGLYLKLRTKSSRKSKMECSY